MFVLDAGLCNDASPCGFARGKSVRWYEYDDGETLLTLLWLLAMAIVVSAFYVGC